MALSTSGQAGGHLPRLAEPRARRQALYRLVHHVARVDELDSLTEPSDCGRDVYASRGEGAGAEAYAVGRGVDEPRDPLDGVDVIDDLRLAVLPSATTR